MNRNFSMIIIAFGAWISILGLRMFLQSLGSNVNLISIVILFAGVASTVFGVQKHYQSLNKSFSKTYYMLPILLPLIGAIIVYFIFKNKDKEIGNSLGWIGFVEVLFIIIVTIIQGLVSLAVFLG